MALVQYDSSDEDEEVQSPAAPQNPTTSAESKPQDAPATQTTTPSTATAPQPPASSPPTATPKPSEPLGPVLGPALGPPRPPGPLPRPSPSTTDAQQEDEEEIDLAFLTNPANQSDPPRSPYTTTRALLRDLTLPAVPDMAIPPSPPGSPPPGLDALTAKFDHFLRLKRERGVHFNERLAAARGMRNPGVMDRLLGFVGVETEFSTSLSSATFSGGDDRGGEGGGAGAGAGDPAVEQYATVLSAEVWDPRCFPAWAYKGPLRKAQEKMNKERERGRGEPVEFVSAGSTATAATGSAAGSRAGTPGVGGTGKRSLKGKWDT